MVTRLALRSISTLAIVGRDENFFSIKSRILPSSASQTAKSFLLANQREFQALLVWRRKLNGLTFCPIYFFSSFSAGLTAFASVFLAGFLITFSTPETSTRMWLDFFSNGKARPREAGL